MGKRDFKKKKANKSHPKEEIKDNLAIKENSSNFHIISDDDEEGNEDLSLKIVEKALLRADVPVFDDVAVVETPVRRKNKATEETADKILEKKLLSEGSDETAVVGVMDEDNADMIKAMEDTQTDPIENSDSLVFRKLLRGPRYFDPTGSSWGACYNCGEEGHTALNCFVARQRRPCFICGSLEHQAKQCIKGQDCYICKKGGHRAKDCPEKNRGSSKLLKICLKCGDSGHHDIFSCKNDYSAEDLKEIQCYVCKSFGHLCCSDFTNTSPRELSCYRCGQLGHGGFDCGKSEKFILRSPGNCYVCKEVGHIAKNCPGPTKDFAKSPSEKTSLCSRNCHRCGENGHMARECPGSAKGHGESHKETCYRCGEAGHFARECHLSNGGHGESHNETCYRCGEAGHFARECHLSNGGGKRKPELSTPTQKFPNEKVRFKKAKSMTSEDFFKGKKGKETEFNEGWSPASYNLKKRGGWITDNPVELYDERAEMRHWVSPPQTPTYRHGHDIRSVGGSTPYRYSPSDDSFNQYRQSPSNGSYHQYVHAPSNIGTRRNPYLSNESRNFFHQRYVTSESPNFFHQRYATSRFNNSSSDGRQSTGHRYL